MVLGGGPNRIGQGIEFDYCCVHAAWPCARTVTKTIMVNCNPETVSDRLRHLRPSLFRAGHPGDVLEIVNVAKPNGVIVQYGGQTPLKLRSGPGSERRAGHRDQPDAIDRRRIASASRSAVTKPRPQTAGNATVTALEQAVLPESRSAHPVAGGAPSYVLGGRAMGDRL